MSAPIAFAVLSLTGITVDSAFQEPILDQPHCAPKCTGLHALRHFYASCCINRKEDGGLELPAKIVQARLGHASIVMTMDRYGHLFPGTDDGAETRTCRAGGDNIVLPTRR